MIGKFLGMAAFCGTLLYIGSGCSADPGQKEDLDRYRTISSRLQTGGSYYSVQNPRYLLDSIDRSALRFYQMLNGMQERPEQLDEILEKSLGFALMYRLSGIDDLIGYGSSSVRISKENEPLLFHNLTFVAVKPESTGYLWQLAGSENRPLAPEWEALPASTRTAVDMQLTPDAIIRAVRSTQKLKELLDDPRVKMFTGETVEQLVAGISGEYGFVVLDGRNSPEAISGYHTICTMPDAGGRLFSLLSKGIAFLPGSKVEKDSIQLPPMPPRVPVSVRIESHDGRLTLYSSASAKEAFIAQGPRLVDTEQFKQLRAGLPEDGLGFFYVNCSYADVLSNLARTLGLDLEFSEKDWTQLQLTVLRREADGFLLTGNSDLDENQYKVASVLIPLVAIAESATEFYAEQRNSATEAEEAEAPDTTQECQQQLKIFENALNEYASKHDGSFPQASGINGLRELIADKLLPASAAICPGAAGEDEPAEKPEDFSFDNCSYLYFGGFTTQSNPKLPLIVDWPFNHKGAVNVLLIDGTVRKLEMEAGNCRRVVSTLQALYQYNEKDFKALLSQADELDRLFDLN